MLFCKQTSNSLESNTFLRMTVFSCFMRAPLGLSGLQSNSLKGGKHLLHFHYYIHDIFYQLHSIYHAFYLLSLYSLYIYNIITCTFIYFLSFHSLYVFNTFIHCSTIITTVQSLFFSLNSFYVHIYIFILFS